DPLRRADRALGRCGPLGACLAVRTPPAASLFLRDSSPARSVVTGPLAKKPSVRLLVPVADGLRYLAPLKLQGNSFRQQVHWPSRPPVASLGFCRHNTASGVDTDDALFGVAVATPPQVQPTLTGAGAAKPRQRQQRRT